MANNSLFSSSKSKFPVADALNHAGGNAYSLDAKQKLAQLAVTGTFNGVFYATGRSQLDSVIELIDQINDDVFLAKLALFARERAYMKDMPAALLVALSVRNSELTHKIFDRVVDNGRVLRTVFQMVRSGRFGRTGLSSSLKRAFQNWLNNASVAKLLSASIGKDPALRDIFRMARPRPKDNMRRALFGWLIGNPSDKWAPASENDLPNEVLQLIRYRMAETEQEQVEIVSKLSVRWDLLASAAKGPAVWAGIARRMGPQALRMNLNTLMRQNVFDGANSGWVSQIAEKMGMTEPRINMVEDVAERLADVDSIVRSRQFPYQYFAAYLNAADDMPMSIHSALQKAAQVACGQIPSMPGPVIIGVDVSGSMGMSATGHRGRSKTSKVRCVDVAALFAAAIKRRNPDSVVIPFDTKCYDLDFALEGDGSILEFASKLSRFGGGGTNCSLPIELANTTLSEYQFAGAILVSDNQSWVGNGRRGSTALMSQWQNFVDNQVRLNSNANPKLICIDIQPYGTAQAPERQDILNVGGFSDSVFAIASAFLESDQSRFVVEIEAVEI